MKKEEKVKKSKPKNNVTEELTNEKLDSIEELPEKDCECSKNECHCADHGCGCNGHCHNNEEENKEAVYFEALQRTMAEFDNYRKRTTAASDKARLDGICQAISAILPSVDALDNAIKMLGDNAQVISGLKLVKENILNSFKNLGLEEIDALNKPFDPDYHNAVSAGEVEGVEEGIIVEEYQKGYKLGDRVVRYTMCRVSK